MPPRTRKATTTPATQPATEPKEETMTTSTAPVPAIANVSFSGLAEETDPNPFARGEREAYGERSRIPEDHPLYPAVMSTYKAEKAARVETTEPDALIRLLRKIAEQQGISVRTAVVTLDGVKLKPVPGKGKDQPAFITTVSGREIQVSELQGMTGKFAPITEGTTVRVRFQGVEKTTRPTRAKN